MQCAPANHLAWCNGPALVAEVVSKERDELLPREGGSHKRPIAATRLHEKSEQVVEEQALNQSGLAAWSAHFHLQPPLRWFPWIGSHSRQPPQNLLLVSWTIDAPQTSMVILGRHALAVLWGGHHVGQTDDHTKETLNGGRPQAQTFHDSSVGALVNHSILM